MNRLHLIFGVLALIGLPSLGKAAEPTLADILKVWEEREKACVSLEMTWKETTHVPKGTISKIFDFQKEPILNPNPASDIKFEGTGKFGINNNNFSGELEEVLFSKIHKDNIYLSKCRVVLNGNQLSYVNLTQTTTKVPYAFELGKNSIQCPANGLALLLNILIRGQSGGYWDAYAKGIKSLTTETQILNGDPMRVVEVSGDPTKKLILLIDQTDLFRVRKMSIVYPKTNDLQSDFVIDYPANSAIPRAILINNFRDFGQPLLVSSHNLEVKSWEAKAISLGSDYNVEYPKQTMIQKHLPDGKTESSGIALDGTRQVITEPLATQEGFLLQVEQKAKQSRQRQYIWIVGGVLVIITFGVLFFRIKWRK